MFVYDVAEEVTTEEETQERTEETETTEQRVEVVTQKIVERSKVAIQVTKTEESGEEPVHTESFAIVWSCLGESSLPEEFVLPRSPRDPHAPRFLLKPKSVRVSDGDPVCFRSRVDCPRSSSVTWLFNGAVIGNGSDIFLSIFSPDGNIELRIAAACPQYQGEYVCCVANAYGVARCSAWLNLRTKPRGLLSTLFSGVFGLDYFAQFCIFVEAHRHVFCNIWWMYTSYEEF